jgi:NADPH:quinone reductase-like Zn-dependent oxidoreductase
LLAAVFDRHGPPESVIQVKDVPPPVPGPGEVRVRMRASPVNPSDLQYVRGGYGLTPTFPATPGFEGVGVVEAGGGLYGNFLRGRRVAVLNGRTGNWAELAVAPARTCIPIPGDIPDEQAAAFFVNPATAVALTRHVLRVPAGEWLLQTAAGSALGKMVIRLGKQDGFRTVNVVRRREQVEELNRLGADVVLIEGDGPLPEQVPEATGDGVKYAIDPVGGRLGGEVVASLAAGGTAVLYGLLSGEPVAVDPRFLITGSKRVQGFWLADWMKTRGLAKKLRLVRTIRQLIRAGVLTSEIGETYPLARVQDAVKAAAAPGKAGKVLLRIGTGG